MTALEVILALEILVILAMIGILALRAFGPSHWQRRLSDRFIDGHGHIAK